MTLTERWDEARRRYKTAIDVLDEANKGLGGVSRELILELAHAARGLELAGDALRARVDELERKLERANEWTQWCHDNHTQGWPMNRCCALGCDKQITRPNASFCDEHMAGAADREPPHE